jgi:membrane protein DedA with SNARE-associated domain
MILAIVCVFAGIALVDLPAIWRHQKRRELIVYLLVLIPALVMAILITSGVKIPSALDALGNLFERFFGKIYTQ